MAAINTALKTAKFKKEIIALEIKGEDTKMKELVQEEGIILIGAQKYSICAVVLSLLRMFHKVLEEDEDNPVLINRLKKVFKEDMKESRCEKNINNKVLAKVIYFDKKVLESQIFRGKTKGRSPQGDQY